jgi:hypothetical protein
MIAYGAVAAKLAAAKIEIDAIGEAGRVVDEVNRLLVAPETKCGGECGA